jgi:hypothetical protein
VQWCNSPPPLHGQNWYLPHIVVEILTDRGKGGGDSALADRRVVPETIYKKDFFY